MKKIIFILGILFLTCSNIQAKKLFVEMEFHKNSIKLDDGSNKKPQPIKGDDGKDLKFTSLIGALNYMSLQGWELVDTKSVTSGGGYVGAYGGASSTSTKVYYIFSKDVSDEELKQIVDGSYKKD
ncbi:MAG: hypothetical protein K2N05_05585 [Muribaculaceae bacterium]|nr:hypothetical protein [Muribaculaceae bacterium]